MISIPNWENVKHDFTFHIKIQGCVGKNNVKSTDYNHYNHSLKCHMLRGGGGVKSIGRIEMCLEWFQMKAFHKNQWLKYSRHISLPDKDKWQKVMINWWNCSFLLLFPNDHSQGNDTLNDKVIADFCPKCKRQKKFSGVLTHNAKEVQAIDS